MKNEFNTDCGKFGRLYNTLTEFAKYHKHTVPLCAAENVMSEFCKIPLNGDLQSRYIMGTCDTYDIHENFIGSQHLVPIYSMINEMCRILFGAKHSDARTLTGMNCMTTLLMSLTETGNKIAILPADWGGHPSVRPVCERLGLVVYDLPYQKDDFDLDYVLCNRLINDEDIRYILLAPSDLLRPLAIEELDLNGRELFYDVSQIMGLIAGKEVYCPFSADKDIVIFGGTHKTLPGPASGLIMTNSESIHGRLVNNINPKYLRHTQMHQVASLLFALLEFEQYGSEYAKAIVRTSNKLGAVLERNGFRVAKLPRGYSETHQIFLYCNKHEVDIINHNAIRFGVTLNKKQKPLFKGTGIRLGTQEISRYGWHDDALESIGQIMNELSKENPSLEIIEHLKSHLPPKELAYTFDSGAQASFYEVLHQV